MVQTISILGLILAVVSLRDRRAWPFLIVILAVWWMTNWAETVPDSLQAFRYRLGFDIVGGALSAALIRRHYDRWVVAFFVLMILNHAAFQIAFHLKVNLWSLYLHGINALWLGQMAMLAVPGGRECVGSLVSRYRSWRGLGVVMGDGRINPADPV